MFFFVRRSQVYVCHLPSVRFCDALKVKHSSGWSCQLFDTANFNLHQWTVLWWN